VKLVIEVLGDSEGVQGGQEVQPGIGGGEDTSLYALEEGKISSISSNFHGACMS